MPEYATDIDDFLPVFEEMAGRKDVTRIIELGVRAGHSTRAWLRGLDGDGHLWSVDISPPQPGLIPAADEKSWTFVLGDDTDPEVLVQLPDAVDVILIDTDHDYEHTLAELYLYSRRVRSGGCILCHDTENEHPEQHGERIGIQEPFPVKRALMRFASEQRWVAKLDGRGWGLGWVVAP